MAEFVSVVVGLAVFPLLWCLFVAGDYVGAISRRNYTLDQWKAYEQRHTEKK